jgi:hypothetical protein
MHYPFEFNFHFPDSRRHRQGLVYIGADNLHIEPKGTKQTEHQDISTFPGQTK